MFCVRALSKSSTKPAKTTVIQRGLSRKERVANENLREELRTLGAYDATKHELMGYQSLKAEYLHWRLRRGPLPLQKRFLLRQILALKPERHCSYKGQSVQDLQQELAEAQKQAAQE
eukprot:TRINITY_DN12731_c0_g1_i1.p2 TRINITY_DN12731_c0_g1~~TRINITY_DN12731_c0_g1_i1.p2  ORF type:complete len:117 (-),score=28.34 TRINITY_DN12731_c0_g1_i1:21-371(-)